MHWQLFYLLVLKIAGDIIGFAGKYAKE